jgi:hypothetical protein
MLSMPEPDGAAQGLQPSIRPAMIRQPDYDEPMNNDRN